MKLGVAKETFPGERRVGLTPRVVASLQRKGVEILLEKDAGRRAGFPDDAYREKGVEILSTREELFDSSDALIQVRTAGANPEKGKEDLQWLHLDQIVIGLAEALSQPEAVAEMAERGVTLLALDLIPRIARAQTMDVLSSMAIVAGYKSVLLAAERLPKMFPMMVTAAGTVAPARVFVLGAGVAGLQAIATARRLGAAVEAYDIRPETKREILSLGAKLVDVSLETGDVRDGGGYAKLQAESFYQRQREAIAQVVAASDAVITTAAVPGKRAPVLVSASMVASMTPGSVIVDLAAERGGNCQLTRPGEVIEERGVTIIGPVNLPSTVPFHASQMYAKNASTFFLHLVQDGPIDLDREDEILRQTLVTRNKKIVNPRVLEALSSRRG